MTALRLVPLLFLTACPSSVMVLSDGDVRDDRGVDQGTDAGGEQCQVATDCVLVPHSCCGNCGQPSRTDIDSIPHSAEISHRDLACSDGAGCPACEGMPDPTLLPECSMGSCTVLDLTPTVGSAPLLSACTATEDCVIRAMECCECGATIGATTVVALHQSQRSRYQTHVCPPDFGCEECEPIYPDSIRAICVGEGSAAHCEVTVASSE